MVSYMLMGNKLVNIALISRYLIVKIRESQKSNSNFMFAKGQLISKALFVSSNSSKKQTNKFVFFAKQY